MVETADRASASTLAIATYGFVCVAVLVTSLAAAAVFFSRSEGIVDEALDVAVRARTLAAGESFARVLHGDWVDLEYLAEAAGGENLEDIGALMEGQRGDGSRISWIGYAGVDGIVREASDGLLVGADVSERPWFRNGLRGGFASDVHEAVLLAKKLRPEGGASLRFIDLAQPVRNAEGEVIGVVGMHIDASWAEQMLAETGRMLGLELYLLSNNGTIAMTSDPSPPEPGEVGFLTTARSGTGGASREIWPNGREYFTSLVPEVAYRDLPSFGWRLAGRLEANAFRPGLETLMGTAALALVVALLTLMVLAALFVRIFVRPFSALAESAERMASGELDYPPEVRTTREAARLSGALARLQTRLSTRSGS